MTDQQLTWQPIKTAPRDGTDFLAACPWQKKHHQMVGCFAPNGLFVSWPGRIQGYNPTHWRPLDAPPNFDAEDPNLNKSHENTS